jgi:hypothetical protein
MILIFCYIALLDVNFYMLLCGNNALKQKSSLVRGLMLQDRFLRVNASQLS